MKNLEVPREKIEAFARRWRVSHLALFGSVLREDFNDASIQETRNSANATGHLCSVLKRASWCGMPLSDCSLE